MSVAGAEAAALRAPALARRFAAFAYEGVLLFGVVVAAGLVYGVATGQRHALVGLHGLQAFLFVVLALYFTWFWEPRRPDAGEMQTWHTSASSTRTAARCGGRAR